MGKTFLHKFFILLALSILVLSVVSPPPPGKRQQEDLQKVEEKPAPGMNHEQVETPAETRMYDFPYTQYLELVVKILENQPKFQERLKGMNEEDIKSGKIADHIDDLDKEVFDELTKAKLEEIERLRKSIQDQMAKDGDARNVKMPDHIDVDDWEKFTKEDLRKLIKKIKTVEDMKKADEERKEKFKEYELQKKAEEDHKLAQLNQEERLKAEKELEESKKRHNEHEKLNHPGGREQLEEVWEERDQMDKDSYDPKTFFALHDLNGDGLWNEQELEALFQVELEKVYNETNPDDDPKERIEEMYRMREHVVNQMDKNGDLMISFEEFMQDNEAQEKAPEPEKDPGWDDLAKQKIYTEEELAKFEKEYAQQKGWGEHPYDPTSSSTTQSPSLGQQHDPNRHATNLDNSHQQQQQNLPDPNKFNVMDTPHQQQGAGQAVPVQQQQQHNIPDPSNFNAADYNAYPPQQHQPEQVHPVGGGGGQNVPPPVNPDQKIPKAVDPVYGI